MNRRSALRGCSILLLTWPVFCGFIGSSTGLAAQNKIYPTELYSGINPITLTVPDGILFVEVKESGDWKPLVLGYKTRHYKVLSAPISGACKKKDRITLFIERIDRNFSFEIRVTECDGSRKQYTLALDNTWNLFHEDFGTITLNDRPCHTFRVESAGGSFVIDRIEMPSSDFIVQFPFRKPPVTLRGARTYRYTVCFRPRKLGRVKVPVNVHIRRPQPVGKYTTYIVADTAYINVIAPRNSNDPPIIADTYVPPPKPDPPRYPSVAPKRPPDPPIQATHVQALPGESLWTEREPDIGSERDARADTVPDIPMPSWIHDPTTFRVILTPSARSIGKGKGFVSSYDIAGIVVGYGPTDRLTILGGGVATPILASPIYAVTAGVKFEFVQEESIHVSGGVQTNLSSTDESTILSAVPYITANYGSLDYGVDATAGYSWRRHEPTDSTVAPFTRTAAVLGVGGDVRFARHWKIVGEVFLIQSAEFQPAAATVRWFNDRVAVDAGLAVNMKGTGDLPVIPVVSVVWVW